MDTTPNLNTSHVTCDYCVTELRQGVKHVCNRTARRQNIVGFLRNLSDTTLATAVGTGLKEVASRQGISNEGGSIALQSGLGGKAPLPVQLGQTKKHRVLTSEDIITIKKKLGLSNLKAKVLAQELRVATRDRGAVESDLATSLVKSNHYLEDLFTMETVQVTGKASGKDGKDVEMEEKVLVYCTDVDELVLRLIVRRELDEESMTVKVGLDGGQGSLKIGMSIMRREETTRAGRMLCKEGVASKQCRLSSVNRLIILAMMLDAPENYETTKLMLDRPDMAGLN